MYRYRADGIPSAFSDIRIDRRNHIVNLFLYSGLQSGCKTALKIRFAKLLFPLYTEKYDIIRKSAGGFLPENRTDRRPSGAGMK